MPRKMAKIFVGLSLLVRHLDHRLQAACAILSREYVSLLSRSILISAVRPRIGTDLTQAAAAAGLALPEVFR